MSDDKKSTKTMGAIISIIILIATIWYFYGGGLDAQVNVEMGKIEAKVAKDAEAQYYIAKNNGSAMDAYIQASLVSAAYLQANDERNYKKWKSIENEEKKRAGLNF